MYNVKDYGALGNGSTDDSSIIQCVVNMAATAGGDVVYFPNGVYMLYTSLIPASNVTLLGCGTGSVLITNSNQEIIHTNTLSFSNFTVDSLTFQGTVNEFPSSPQRARTTSGAGATYAVSLGAGAQYPHSPNVNDTDPPPNLIVNFIMRNCIVRNCSELPIRIAGVEGTVSVTNNTFYNNKDVEFIYCSEVIFSDNHIEMSADNGVSILRGNNKLTCTGNTVKNACYDGIFISGSVIDPDDPDPDFNLFGPNDFACTGNTIINTGYNGIILDQGPSNGAVTGNFINLGYFRGPSDQLTDSYGAGIYIGGFPQDCTAPLAYASNINISGNVMFQCARAGVYVVGGANGIDIAQNLIVSCGTEFLSDGTTAVLSSDITQNAGILLRNNSTNSNINVENNTIIDQRNTPYTNWGIYPHNPVLSSPTFTYSNNQMLNCRKFL